MEEKCLCGRKVTEYFSKEYTLCGVPQTVTIGYCWKCYENKMAREQRKEDKSK